MAEAPSTSTTARPTIQRDLSRFGYSSSSDSDEPPRKTNTTANNNSSQKKKKKRKPPPQQSINKIWRRFATKKYTKALSVLPFDPVPLPSTPEGPNELLSVGYERAREECSRRVRKIIQECRRVNTRYRDPGFDLVGLHPTLSPIFFNLQLSAMVHMAYCMLQSRANNNP